MKYPAYPSYKPSDVEWLGEVPGHWEVKRLKTLATYRVSNVDKVPAENEEPVRLCNYTDVYYHERITPQMDLMETTATTDEIKRFRLEKGDVVITKDSEDWSDIAIPALVKESAPDLVCGYHLAFIRPQAKKLNGAFLLRAFQSCAINQQFQIASTGVTRYGLPKSAIGDAWLPLPPLAEQRAIADFLDRQTAKLDTLISKKRALVERLKAKRSALISRTVTRGLPPEAARAAGFDPEPKMRDSGIEWLGEIPEHWTFAQVRRFLTLITSGSRGWAEYYVDSGAIFVRIGNLTRDSIRLDLNEIQYVCPPLGSEGERTRLQAGDVLFSITAYLGSVAVVAASLSEAYISQHVALVRLNTDHVRPEFVAYSALADIGQAQLNGQAYGGTKVQLALDDVKSLWLPVPPIKEQTAIAAYLDRETAKLDNLAATVEQAIARLRDYRTALITAAVSGKIDVRTPP